MGTVLVLGMTACSQQGGDTEAKPFTPSQLSQAMPGKLGAPQGWRGSEPVVYQAPRP
ncbi:hypothetical protein [Streptomyces sp. HUAS TT7]|uniref:hypothetical protein n=1 Tax=Streptomyces sp. HUAS TT7 TaxID=3447507 RepID=UPI003F660337